MSDKIVDFTNDNRLNSDIPLDVLEHIESFFESGLDLGYVYYHCFGHMNSADWAMYIVENFEEVAIRWFLLEHEPNYLVNQKKEIKKLEQKEKEMSSELQTTEILLRNARKKLDRLKKKRQGVDSDD